VGEIKMRGRLIAATTVALISRGSANAELNFELSFKNSIGDTSARYTVRFSA
jgi:hypothetical protein